jgi:hypothetical protein
VITIFTELFMRLSIELAQRHTQAPLTALCDVQMEVWVAGGGWICTARQRRADGGFDSGTGMAEVTALSTAAAAAWCPAPAIRSRWSSPRR